LAEHSGDTVAFQRRSLRRSAWSQFLILRKTPRRRDCRSHGQSL